MGQKFPPLRVQDPLTQFVLTSGKSLDLLGFQAHALPATGNILPLDHEVRMLGA